MAEIIKKATRPFGLALYLLLVLLVTSFVLRSRRVGTAEFKGWTNLLGETHAIVQFPPVAKKQPAKNYFIRWFYAVELKYAYTRADGFRTNESLWLPVYESPTQSTTVIFPVPPQASRFEFTHAATVIERRWDNLGLPLVRPPDSRYAFNPPAVRFQQAY